jgi:ATP-dependent exoDNAse (exonuclease V) beta subunit
LELFALAGPTGVSAGAGSGKTTALVELCLRLLSGEATGTACAPSELAAITFTEKAAEELALRVRAAVAARARAARDAGAGEEARAWAARLAGLDGMAVGTIHGFCGRLLREHAPEAGLDPEFEVADEERASSWLAASAREAVVAALDAGDPGARALVAALGVNGARGGLAELIAGLVRERATRGDEGPPAVAPSPGPEALAARADLLAAAEAFRAAGAGARGKAARDVAAAFAAALAGVGREDRDGPLTAGALSRLSALGDAVRGRAFGRDDADLQALRAEVAARAAGFVPLAAEVLASREKGALAGLVSACEARSAARKRAANVVDFDDLLLGARRLLRGDPAVRAEVRGRLRALLVDEYQDVNPVQEDVLEALAGGPPPGPVRVAVGDLKQSIYRFRGADVAVFTRLLRRLGEGEGRVLHLSDNHRSAPAVLDAVNAVSERVLQPPAGEAPRDDEIAFGPRDRLAPRRPPGEAPAVELLVDGGEGAAAERRAREARAIAARIAALVSGAAGDVVRERRPGGGEAPRRARYADLAVLFRRLTQTREYERALRAAGIPYRLARGGGFYQAPEVRDVGELLALLADPGDAAAWAALLRSPLCLVSDGALVLLARAGLPALLPRGGGAPALPGGLDPGERARLERFLACVRALRALAGRIPAGELAARAAEALDLEAAHLAAPGGARRAVNLEKAIALARARSAAGASAAELARHFRTMAARPPREPEADLPDEDAVALLSVHQAKGLEWPVVFVPDLGAKARNDARRALLDGDGRVCAAHFDVAEERWHEPAALAAAKASDRRSAAAESRRLLYVALTRARDRRVLSGEAANGGETWRGLVEAGLAGREDLARRLPVEEVRTARGGAPAAAPVLAPAGSGAALPATPGPPAPAPLRLALAAVPPTPVRLAVTDLAELSRCPRRHHLGRVLGLPEPKGLPGAPPVDDPGRATARGTLAHALLAECDPAAPPLERRAQLQAAALRRGYDPAARGVKAILSEVTRFLSSPGGRALADAAEEGRLRREVPFLLRLDGVDGAPAVYLTGALDALLRERRGGGLTVVDFKYATPRPGAAERYRVQLAAYALAARRASPGARVRARLQFLRGDLRALDVTPEPAELEAFARRAPALALAALRGDGERPPSELGRDEARCRAEGCGYVTRCHAR